MSNTKNKVKLLNMYVLSTLVCFAAAGGGGKEEEANVLSEQAFQLMGSEDTLALGSVISSALDELNNTWKRGADRVGANITEYLSRLAPQKMQDPLTQKLLGYMANFYPAVMQTVRLPQMPTAVAVAVGNDAQSIPRHDGRLGLAPPPHRHFDGNDDDGDAPVQRRGTAVTAPRFTEETRVQDAKHFRDKAAELLNGTTEIQLAIGGFIDYIIWELENLPENAGIWRDDHIQPLAKKYLDFVAANPARANNRFVRKLGKFIKAYYPDVFAAITSMKNTDSRYAALRAPVPAQFPDSVSSDSSDSSDDEDSRPAQRKGLRGAVPSRGGHHFDPFAGDEEFARRMQEELNRQDSGDAGIEAARRFQEAEDKAYEDHLALQRLETQEALDRMLEREKDERLARRLQDEDAGIGAARALQALLDAERAEAERGEIRSYEMARMIDVLENLTMPDDQKERFMKITDFHGDPTLSAGDQQLVIDSVHGFRNLPRGSTDRVERVLTEPMSMDVVRAVLAEQETIRREEAQRIERERRAEQERLARDAQAREEAERMRVQREEEIRRMGPGVWRIPALGMTPEIVYRLPAELHDNARLFVNFFMTQAQPKLFELLRSGQITHGQYNKVIRAVSMGVFSLQFEADYKEMAVIKARANDFSSLTDVPARAQTPAWMRPGHFGGFSNNSHMMILDPLVRPESPADADTWMYTHVEEDAGTARARIDAAVRGGKSREQAIQEHANLVVDGKMVALSQLIQKTFETLLSKRAVDAQWIPVVRAFVTGRCFDGTTEDITLGVFPVISALEAQGVVAERLSVLYDKINGAPFRAAVKSVGGSYDELVSIPLTQSGLFVRINDALNAAEPLGALAHEHFQKPKGPEYQRAVAAIKAEEEEIERDKKGIQGRKDALLTEEEKRFKAEQQRHAELRLRRNPTAEEIENSKDRVETARITAEASVTVAVTQQKEQLDREVGPRLQEISDRVQAARARRAALTQMLAQTTQERVATNQRLDAAYAPIGRMFVGKTLESVGIRRDVAQAIRTELGSKPGTGREFGNLPECLYTDGEILELLFWDIKKTSEEAYIPPAVTLKYRIDQDLPDTRG